MLTFEQSLARITINICATKSFAETAFVDLCEAFAMEHFNINIQRDVFNEVLKHRLSCEEFYYFNKSSGDRFKSLYRLKTSMREVWIYKLLLSSEEIISAKALKDIVRQKFLEEQRVNPSLTERTAGMDFVVNFQFNTNEKILQVIKLLSSVSSEITSSLDVFSNFFENHGMKQMKTLYGCVAVSSRKDSNVSLMKKPSLRREKTDDVFTARIAQTKETSSESENTLSTQPIIDSHFLDELHKKLLAYESQIKYLEKAVHEKEVKLQYAEKDAVRNIICTLVNERYGSPLNELYLFWKGKHSLTDADLKTTISNLFLAFENLNIKLTREYIVGQVVALTDDNAGKFVQMNGENLTRNDRIIVRYPGYRYRQEIMVRPMVQKLEDENEQDG